MSAAMLLPGLSEARSDLVASWPKVAVSAGDYLDLYVNQPKSMTMIVFLAAMLIWFVLVNLLAGYFVVGAMRRWWNGPVPVIMSAPTMAPAPAMPIPPPQALQPSAPVLVSQRDAWTQKVDVDVKELTVDGLKLRASHWELRTAGLRADLERRVSAEADRRAGSRCSIRRE